MNLRAMRREIKYRGKTASGAWVYGSLLTGLEEDEVYIVESDASGFTKYIVLPGTVGQFTNLQDANGTDIYEGDILRFKITQKNYGVVTYHKDGYFFINPTANPIGYDDLSYFPPLGGMLREIKLAGKLIKFEVAGYVYDATASDIVRMNTRWAASSGERVRTEEGQAGDAVSATVPPSVKIKTNTDMAATDYIICEGFFGTLYLVKKTKQNNKSFKVMSKDRRPLTEGEQIGVFEHYLRQFCKKNDTDTVVINGEGGKPIFEAKLLDKESHE